MFEQRLAFPQSFQPKENSNDYFCYKMKYSLIVQALCDYQGVFQDVEVMWPGSVHDSCLFASLTLD